MNGYIETELKVQYADNFHNSIKKYIEKNAVNFKTKIEEFTTDTSDIKKLITDNI